MITEDFDQWDMKDFEIWFKRWQLKLASAWIEGDDEEEAWLQIEYETMARASEKRIDELSWSGVGNPTGSDDTDAEKDSQE